MPQSCSLYSNVKGAHQGIEVGSPVVAAMLLHYGWIPLVHQTTFQSAALGGIIINNQHWFLNSFQVNDTTLANSHPHPQKNDRICDLLVPSPLQKMVIL